MPNITGGMPEVGELGVELGCAPLDLHRAVERDLRVVLDGQRRAEHGEHLVADELQDRAAVREDGVGDHLVEVVEHRPDLGRLERRRERREAAEVAEEEARVEPLTVDVGIELAGLLELARHRLGDVLREQRRHAPSVAGLGHVPDRERGDERERDRERTGRRGSRRARRRTGRS